MEPMDRYERELQRNRTNRMLSILDAAEDLFAQKGIERTTMQDIANAANIGVATVFRAFPKKEQIAVAIATQKLKKFLELFKKVYNMQVKSIEKIEALMDYFLEEVLSEEENDIKIIEDFNMYSLRLKGPITDIEQYKEVYKEISKTFSKIIKEAITDGSIRTDIDVERSLITLINAYGTFTSKLSIQKDLFFIELDLEPEKQLDLFKKIILDYLKKGS